MTAHAQITAFLGGLDGQKGRDIQQLHALFTTALPDQSLSFSDGKNAEGKIVANPSIGYGVFTKSYADGSTKDSFRIGLSANSSGISVYIMTLDDKTHLTRTYGPTLGKAKVTGYCIMFKRAADIDLAVLEAAIRDGASRIDATT